MKSTKIASIAVDENDNILANNFDFTGEKGIKLTLNGKCEITSLFIPEALKNSPELEKLLTSAINQANAMVKETIQSLLIKELIKQDPQLINELDFLTKNSEEDKKSWSIHYPLLYW